MIIVGESSKAPTASGLAPRPANNHVRLVSIAHKKHTLHTLFIGLWNGLSHVQSSHLHRQEERPLGERLYRLVLIMWSRPINFLFPFVQCLCKTLVYVPYN